MTKLKSNCKHHLEIFILFLLMPWLPAHASPSISVSAGFNTYYLDDRPRVGYLIEKEVIPVSVSVIDHKKTSEYEVSAFSYAYGAYGVLKAASKALSVDFGDSETGALASFTDSIVFHAAGLEGQRGLLKTSFDFFWRTAIVESPGNPNQNLVASFAANVGASFLTATQSESPETYLTTRQITGYDPISTGFVRPFSFHTELLTEIVFGTPIDINLSLGTHAAALSGYSDSEGFFRPGGRSQYEIDASQSAYWGGIEVFDDSGSKVTDFLVDSESGTNWNQSFVPADFMAPVPEPSSWALLSMGTVFLYAASRRRRRL